MRKGINPETREVFDEDMPLTVLEVNEDASGYGLVPEYTSSSSMWIWIIPAAVIAAAAVTCVIIRCRKSRKKLSEN